MDVLVLLIIGSNDVKLIHIKYHLSLCCAVLNGFNLGVIFIDVCLMQSFI